MYEEKIYIDLQNFILPLILLESPWLKEKKISFKQIAFWCLFSVITYKGHVEVIKQILELHETFISDVLKLINVLVANLCVPYLVFYYQIWKRQVLTQFSENQKTIDKILGICYLPISKTEIISLVLMLFFAIIKLTFDTLTVFDKLSASNLLLWLGDFMFLGLSFQWIMLHSMVKVRYNKAKEMISLLADCPEHLKNNQSIHFEGVEDQDSIEVFRLIKYNHVLLNDYFAFLCRSSYAMVWSWLIFSCYEVRQICYLEEDKLEIFSMLAFISMGFMYLLIFSITTIDLNNKTGQFVMEIDKVRTFQKSPYIDKQLSLLYLEVQHHPVAITCFDFNAQSLTSILAVFHNYLIILIQFS